MNARSESEPGKTDTAARGARSDSLADGGSLADEGSSADSSSVGAPSPAVPRPGIGLGEDLKAVGSLRGQGAPSTAVPGCLAHLGWDCSLLRALAIDSMEEADVTWRMARREHEILAAESAIFERQRVGFWRSSLGAVIGMWAGGGIIGWAIQRWAAGWGAGC